jgi:type III pantothenate kinase
LSVSDALAPVDALLAVDVGNTRIGMAVWDDDGLHEATRVQSDQSAGWRAAIEETWAGTSGAKSRAIVIGSVNRKPAREFADLAQKICEVEPLHVVADIPLPMPLKTVNSRQVGVDRVCAAAAAFDRMREPCAIASFGTATTIDCVSAEGEFLGGAILPGIEMSYWALHERTSVLPRVAAASPTDVFAKNTHDAIVNGVSFGAIGALREIVERFATDLGAWPKLVVTGGHAPMLIEHADFIDAHVPNLCLMGVALAYRRAAGQT